MLPHCWWFCLPDNRWGKIIRRGWKIIKYIMAFHERCLDAGSVTKGCTAESILLCGVLLLCGTLRGAANFAETSGGREKSSGPIKRKRKVKDSNHGPHQWTLGPGCARGTNTKFKYHSTFFFFPITIACWCSTLLILTNHYDCSELSKLWQL